MRHVLTVLGAFCALSACTHGGSGSGGGAVAASASFVPPPGLEAAIAAAIDRPNVAGLGLAIVRDGRIVWTGYYGEQAPGVPVTAETMFNTASVAKTIITETVLRLADRGALSLDDPIADFYRHPDLADDPRYWALTPRIILSHQAGLLNWPHLYEDRKLAFVHDPGSGTISYSGAAVEMLAHYLEQRFGKTYPEIVDEALFTPLRIDGLAVRREAWMDGRVPHPIDSDGNYHAPFTLYDGGPLIPLGEWSAADNLFATVEGYADFLAKLIRNEGLSAEMAAERRRLHSASETEPGYQCILPAGECPDPLGYGVGWAVFGEPDRNVLNHGGNDFGEHAQVYFIPETGDALVMFMNGSDFRAGARILAAVDPDLRMIRHYRALLERMEAQQAE